MSGSAESYRMLFRLPPALQLRAPLGRLVPCLHRCFLEVAPSGLVEVRGPDRQALFDQAARFLRPMIRNLPKQVIDVVVVTPAGQGTGGPARDSWQLTINAGIAFSPGPIKPTAYDTVTVLASG